MQSATAEPGQQDRRLGHENAVLTNRFANAFTVRLCVFAITYMYFKF